MNRCTLLWDGEGTAVILGCFFFMPCQPKPFDIAGGASNIIASHTKSGLAHTAAGEDLGGSMPRPNTQNSFKKFEEPSNPFTLPSEDLIYKMRHREREMKEAVRASWVAVAWQRSHARYTAGLVQAKEEASRLKVWEKTTASSRVGRTRRIDDSDIPETPMPPALQRAHAKGVVAAATAAVSQERRSEKEDMSEFIAKKREMFLVQMSLDTKRSEIQKLESKVQMKEQALKKSEVLLEEVRPCTHSLVEMESTCEPRCCFASGLRLCFS